MGETMQVEVAESVVLVTIFLVGGKTHKVHIAGEDWRQLDHITTTRRVIEVAIPRVNTVVAHVVEYHKVARLSIFGLDQNPHSALSVNRVR